MHDVGAVCQDEEAVLGLMDTMHLTQSLTYMSNLGKAAAVAAAAMAVGQIQHVSSEGRRI